MRIAIVAAVLLVSATALAQSSGVPSTGSPACTRENGCSFTACYPAALPGGAVAHYFCDCKTTGAAGLPPAGQQPQAGCVAGSDAASGLTPATAKQTYGAAQAIFSGLNADDRILFCNGGAFDDTGSASQRWANTTVSAAHPAVVGTYDATWGGGGVRPVMLNALATNIFDLNSSDTPKGGYVFAGLDIEGIGQPATACASSSPFPMEGFFVYNQVNDVLICDVKIAWQCIGVEMAGGNVTTDDNQRFTIRNSAIYNNDAQGLLGSGSSLVITRSLFDYNGKAASNLDHNIYYSSGISTNSQITYSELYRAAPVGGGGCDGVSLVTHGVYDGLLIQGNWIHEPAGTAKSGCYGVGAIPGYPPIPEMFNRVQVIGNLFTDMGGVDVDFSAVHNGLIQSNVFVASSSSAHESVALTNDSLDVGDWTNDTVTVSGNTAYGAGVSYREQTGVSIAFANNLAWHTETGTVACFSHGLSAVSYTFMDNNWCYGPSAGTLNWTGTSTLAAWRVANSFDLLSTSGTDPTLTSVTTTPTYTTAAASFIPTALSGLVSVGSNTWTPSTDYAGLSRPQRAVATIGALELPPVASTPGGFGRNRPISYGGWFLLALFVLGAGALAGHLSVKKHRAELADAQHVHYIDGREVAALTAKADASLALMLARPCERCGEPLLLPRQDPTKKRRV